MREARAQLRDSEAVFHRRHRCDFLKARAARVPHAVATLSDSPLALDRSHHAAASPLAGAPRRACRLASSVAVTAAAFALLAAPVRAASVTPTRTASPSPTTVSPSSSPSYAPGVITTVAGSGVAGFGGDGGAATSSALNELLGIVLDAGGNLFVADHSNHRVRRVAAGTGIITTVAGNGVAGYSGDGSAATSVSLNVPHGVCFDLDGNLLIAEVQGHRVRRVAAGTGVITTVAGTGVQGFSGDGGPATSARLSGPVFTAIEPTGDLFIAEFFGHRVRRWAAGTNIVTTVAGTGVQGFSGDGGAAISARLNGPEGLALDRAGNLYIAELYNNRVRRVAAGTGTISTVAGDGVGRFSGDLGPSTSASLHGPIGLAFDQWGSLLIVDAYSCRVRRVAAGTGIISTVVGNGVCGFSGDGGAVTSASLHFPADIALDPAGNIYIAERDSHRVRRISALTQPSSTPSATPSSTPYCEPALFRSLPRTDLVGTLVGTALTPGEATLVASEAACRQACCDAPVCEGYAFEASIALFQPAAPCHLYVNVTQLIPTSSVKSGVLESML